MDVKAFLNELVAKPFYKKQIAYMKAIDAREARYGDIDVPGRLREALSRIGVDRLYTHQAESIKASRRGANFVVVTGTASGKTLCYNVPVLEALHKDAGATALFLFPTKALTQNQLAGIERLAKPETALAERVVPGIYDGDTPSHQRSKIRSRVNVLLTNPDMLHTGILPYHPKWKRFFEGLRYVVVDEIHTYRGIFGSHVANVIRRLRRVADHYGAAPRFIASSATIANPQSLAEKLVGELFELIDDDGSPQGEKMFVLWNPPVADARNFLRRSSNIEASELLAQLVGESCSTILFAKARIVAELVHRYTAERLKRDKHTARLAKRIAPYRGGYLPEDRRRIEKDLFSGKLLAVTSTNALELGIDVGSLDAAIILGYPGTRAAVWQQAGRAGRRGAGSLAILVAYDEPVDQYIANRADYLFGEPIEEATIDPDNVHVLHGHVLCAAAERPLAESEADFLGRNGLAVANALERDGQLKLIGGMYYLSSQDFPAAKLNLRLISSDTYEIIDVSGPKPRAVGSVDSISAPELVYPGAVYLHEGRSYLCETLDSERKIAEVRPGEVDYYTQPVLASSVKVTDKTEAKTVGAFEAALGDIDVTWTTVGFKKVRFLTMEMIGQGELDLPSQTLSTRALWLMPDEWIFESLKDLGYNPLDGMVGAKNILMSVLSMLAMSDLKDIWGMVSARNTKRPAIFLYDRYPGGIGYAERSFERVDQMLRRAIEAVEDCPCTMGCPSCVGLPNPRPPLHHDPELYRAGGIVDKTTTKIFLHNLVAGAPAAEGSP
jgi:DEAD/DEAH box helicase domain-containing protein